jgi:triacylglycerol lipase
MIDCQVYLVPGFFGFSTLGSLDYFRGVAAALRSSLLRRGLRAEIVQCSTRPTGFVKYRARHLAEQVAAHGGTEAEELHFVGHSTGGLDVRQLLTPAVKLANAELTERIGARTRSAMLISTPHRGTPLAQFFVSMRGRETLRLLASEASTRGRLAIYAAAKLLHVVASADDLLGQDENVLDMLSRHVLRNLTLDDKDPVWTFLRQIAADQGAMLLLTTEWMDHFNATVIDRESVHYGSVVTAAPPPLGRGLLDLLRRRPLTLGAGYAILHTLSAWTPTEPSSTPLPPRALAEARRRLPLRLHAQTNDGVVPTLSQLYGELVSAVLADHADIVGQFRRWGTAQYTDWLPSGSHFDEATFARVWDDVAGAIAASRTR